MAWEAIMLPIKSLVINSIMVYNGYGKSRGFYDALVEKGVLKTFMHYQGGTMNMKRLIYLSIIVTVILMLTGCTIQSLPTDVEGQWDLETISNESGEILSVGKAYNNYDDWGGHKEDIGITFNKDNTFETTGFGENLLGKYNKSQELSTKDAIAINMKTDSETEIIASYGIRQDKNDEEMDSLIFTVDKKIYSFIKPITN